MLIQNNDKSVKRQLTSRFGVEGPPSRSVSRYHLTLSAHDEDVMRKYIRHPSRIPIDFQIDDAASPTIYQTKDVSQGGLCFQTDRPMPRGKKIRLRIPLAFQIGVVREQGEDQERFEAEGVVAWCCKESGRYAVGVKFLDPGTRFGVRMVEQVCHIEHYRHDVLLEQGRELTSEEAAREWVERYAAEFPC